MSEPLLRSASDVAAMVRRKEISSRELTGMLLDRIDAVNPRLNAVVELPRERAVAVAATADEELARGGPDDLGPFHGVPMTIKDAFDVAGLHTTWGNPAFKDFVADDDATVVRRLQRAGAIVAGKTNVPFMLGDFGQTANDLYGVTNNPWDTTRTPGGSSGGAAAAVSAGLSFLEYGTDLVGSIRIPASFCGTYGMRPSVSTVPLTGMQPPGLQAGPSDMMYLPAAGPMGRSAADVRTALRVTAGPDGSAARAYSWSLPAPRHDRLEDFRVGVVLDHSNGAVSDEVAALLSETVATLARAGATIVDGWPEGVHPAQQAESFGFHLGLFFAHQQGQGDFAPLSSVIEHEARRMASRAPWSSYFEDIDVFLCPVSFTPAFPHDPRPFDERTIATPEGERPYTDLVFWIAQAALPGLPSMTAPIGRTPAGLPVGAQIVGPLYEDDTPIRFAELLGDVVGGYEPPPL